ncbi:calcium-binding protein [Bradyrhizobium sp. Leo170]|uniref:calcium-binding protein n=1 Tax=Bradyrhizobium sp. Leo170 TaxID=1571199 RepID=UPI00102EB612|nr:calcium-binding protein [Bradyrhizobium sp. Leo170]
MQTLSVQGAWYRPFMLPEPPSPPDIFQVLQDAAAPPATSSQAGPGQSTGAPDAATGEGSAPANTSSSIGTSPVVQAFLLRLQELGLSTVSGTDGNDQLAGWSKSLVDAGTGNDTIDVWSDSVVDGGAGNDQIDAWSGSIVDGGDGSDVIKAWSDTTVRGGAGDDVISGWSNSKINGGDGDDQISAWSDSLVEGGAGNDRISAYGNANVSGGSGDDTIWVGSDSVVNFAKGDGHDTIYAGPNTMLKLGDGLSADNTRVSVSGSVATISFEGSDDSIMVQFGPYSPATLAFADGTALTITPESRIARTPYSASA